MQALQQSLRTTSSSLNFGRSSNSCHGVVQHNRQQVAARPAQQQTSHICQAAGNDAAALGAAALLVLQPYVSGSQMAVAAPMGSNGSSLQHQQQWQQQQHQWQPVMGDLAFGAAAAPAIEDEEEEENLQEIEDDIMTQVAIPQELTNFMQMMQNVRVAIDWHALKSLLVSIPLCIALQVQCNFFDKCFKPC